MFWSVSQQFDVKSEQTVRGIFDIADFIYRLFIGAQPTLVSTFKAAKSTNEVVNQLQNNYNGRKIPPISYLSETLKKLS